MNKAVLLTYLRTNGKDDVDFSGRNALDARAQSRHKILPFKAVSNSLPDVIAHRVKALAIQQKRNKQIIPPEVAIGIDKLGNGI